MPGSSVSFGLGNSPRSVTWPVPGSTVVSENSSFPSCGIDLAVVEDEAHPAPSCRCFKRAGLEFAPQLLSSVADCVKSA